MTLQSEKKDKETDATLSNAFIDYEKSLHRHSFFKLHNRELSEDLVQDTFTKTWIYLIQGGKIELMRAFLFHTLNCLIIDNYRKHKTLSLDVLLEKGYEPSSGGGPDHFMKILESKAVFLLIDKLPEKYQIILHMRYTQNLSLAEMSLLTGHTKNALAVQVHRGLEKLKVLYDQT